MKRNFSKLTIQILVAIFIRNKSSGQMRFHHLVNEAYIRATYGFILERTFGGVTQPVWFCGQTLQGIITVSGGQILFDVWQINPPAMAYAKHVLDTYNHFAFRFWFKKYSKTEDNTLESDFEVWLEKYFDDHGKIKNAQLNFWMQATNT